MAEYLLYNESEVKYMINLLKRIWFIPVLVLSLFLCSCGDSYDYSWVPFEELPEDYTLEDAKADNCVVNEDFVMTSGKQVWENFLNKTENNEPATVRCVHYYADSANMFILDLEFDGEKYIWSDYSDEVPRVSEYKYLLRYEENDPPEYATYSSGVRYALVDDDTYTLDELQNSLLSSQSEDAIDFHWVFIELDYK